jgi:hypothetical protein
MLEKKKMDSGFQRDGKAFRSASLILVRRTEVEISYQITGM